MKKWFESQPGEVKLLLHLISLFFLFLSFSTVLKEVARGGRPQAWVFYFSAAFACSCVLEIFFKYVFFIPGYCKSQNKNGAQA